MYRTPRTSILGPRKERPLPPKGCSTAFFIFLALIILALIASYIVYKHQ